MKPSESQWEEEKNAKLQAKYGNEGQATSEEDREWLEKKAY